MQAFAPNVSKNTLGKRNVLVNNALRIRAVNKDDKEDDQLNSPSNNNRSLSRVGGRRKKKMVKENTSKRKEAFVPLISGLLGFILLRESSLHQTAIPILSIIPAVFMKARDMTHKRVRS